MEIVDPDYIVVGAGSAGCILAAELSQDGKNSILLLEAGPTDFHPYVKIPLGYGLLFKDDTRNYRYESVPEKMLGNRKLYVPRGKVVGGSGSINAMVYCRGMPSDYDDWKRSGLVNWGWEEAKSAFQANEKRDPYGTGVMVTNPIAERHPFTAVFAAACEELAVPHCDDFNGTSSEGWGYYHITTQSGARHSAADAFLRPALRKGGVRLVTNAVVQRINMAHGRAVGVTFIKNSTSHSVRARRAVVLSAGAINSPQILQVSGIGDGAYLQKIGVNTLVDNRNVGAHLQEHLTIGYYYMSFAPTLNSQLHSLPAKIFQTVRYLFTRRGPLSNSVNQFGGFIRTSSELSAPDQQIYFNPVTYTVARSSGGRHVQADAFPAFTLSFQPTRPTSRGSVNARSPDISIPPDIFFNALSTEKDCRDVIAGGRFVGQVVQTQALRSAIKRPMGSTPDRMTDDEILADFRIRAGTVFHPCGTCVMGNRPADSVVDAELRVHGVGGLYVADASVFPSIPSGNINAATMMVARRAAGFILKHH